MTSRQNNPSEKSKKKKKMAVDFKENLMEKHMGFLRFVAFEASRMQLPEVLYEIEPNQLVAVRHIVNIVKNLNKNFISDFVRAEQAAVPPPRRFKSRYGGKHGRATLKQPITPEEAEGMRPLKGKRVNV